jgi:hypothetical protein
MYSTFLQYPTCITSNDLKFIFGVLVSRCEKRIPIPPKFATALKINKNDSQLHFMGWLTDDGSPVSHRILSAEL